MRLHNQRDLLAVAAATVLSVVVVLLPETVPAPRPVAATLLATLLPGYALIAALLPDRPLGLLERVALAVGASMSLTVLLGIVLDRTPLGLRTPGWAVALGGVTLLAALLASRRRSPASRDAAGSSPRRVEIAPANALVLALVAAISMGAIAIAANGAGQQPRPGFTQFWVVPPQNGSVARIGVRNEEGRVVAYTAEARAGATVIRRWPAFELAPGAVWEDSLEIGAAGPASPVELDLYRADQGTTPYRQLTLWPNDR